ncbi:hypothetical protein ACNKHU_15740 [Shigella flexneri]
MTCACFDRRLVLLAPWHRSDAAFACAINAGKLAFIPQSAAVSNTILDSAQQRELGFSTYCARRQPGYEHNDLLDYLARDREHGAISCFSRGSG